MKATRSLWILPDREQTGDLEVVESGRRHKLREALNVSALPRVLTLGVPEPVLQEYPDANLVYAQYVRSDSSEQSIFAISVRCGKDKSGRTVHLTGLLFLPPYQIPELPPDDPALPEEERQTLNDLHRRFNSMDVTDIWMESIRRMQRAIGNKPSLRSFANVYSASIYHQPEWVPNHKKKLLWLVALLLFLVVLMFIVGKRLFGGSSPN